MLSSLCLTICTLEMNGKKDEKKPNLIQSKYCLRDEMRVFCATCCD